MASRLARRTTWCLVGWWFSSAVALAAESVPAHLNIEPSCTILDGRRASAQLIATGSYTDDTVRDLTREGSWSSSDPAIVMVQPGGRIAPAVTAGPRCWCQSGRARPRRSSRS